MTFRSVYLGLLDIDIRGKLDLNNIDIRGMSDFKKRREEITSADVVKYLFSYALVADEVCMQGSAPLKSTQVFGAFMRLSEAFQRDETHEESPVFSFVLSNEAESYLDYLVERLSFLGETDKGKDNTEKNAYLSNNGLVVAKALDKSLNLRNVKKRTKSVSKEYKTSFLLVLRSGRFEEHGIKDEIAEKAIKILTDEEVIQTHHLLNALTLSDVEQVNAIYRAAREKYRKANAYGSESLNSETKAHFKFKNVSLYLDRLGFSKVLNRDPILTPTLLFKLRALKSLQAMNDVYFGCQDQADINALFEILHQLKINGRFKSLIKESPGAAVAFFFEALDQAGIGNKSINKVLEQLAKAFFVSVTDEVFAKKIYAIHLCIENLERDLSSLSVIR